MRIKDPPSTEVVAAGHTNETYLALMKGDPNTRMLMGSTDRGNTWTSMLNFSAPDTAGLNLTVRNAGRIFLGTPDGIIYSFDYGQTWQQTVVDTLSDIRRVRIGNNNSTMLAFSPDGAGITANYSRDWKLLAPPRNVAPHTIVDGVVTSLGDIYIAVSTGNPVDTTSGIYKSQNLGQSWIREPNTPLEPTHLLILANDNMITYADGGIYCKQKGSTWIKRIWSDDYKKCVFAETDGGGILLFGIGRHHGALFSTTALISTDGGLTFQDYKYNSESFTYGRNIHIFPGGNILWSTGWNFLFLDEGEPARQLEILNGPTTYPVSVGCIGEGHVFVGTYSRTFHKIRNEIDWQIITRNGSYATINGEYIQGKQDSIFAFEGYHWPLPERMMKYHPDGNTVSIVDDSLPSLEVNISAAGPDGTIYISGTTVVGDVGISFPVYASSNNGLSWNELPGPVKAPRYLFVHPDGRLVAAVDKDIYTYRSGASSWDLHASLDRHYEFAHAADGTLFAHDNHEIRYSSDLGNTWTTYGNEYFDWIGNVLINSRKNVFIFDVNERTNDYDDEIFATYDNGATWIDVAGSLKKIGWTDIAIDNRDYIYLATSWGLYRSSRPVAVGEFAHNLPISFSLSPAYPNPVSSGEAATVEYALSRPGDVSLKVYNILGVEVYSSQTGRQTPGAHTLSIPTRGLAPGVYRYTVNAGGERRTGMLAVR